MHCFRRFSVVLGLAAALLSFAGPPARAAQPAPVGTWLTRDNDAVIAIGPCGTALCGRIVGIVLDKPNDPIPRDYQGRTQCDLTIINDFVPDGDNRWKGRIIDPRDGKTYDAEMWVDRQHRLNLRGYVVVPLFGQTQIWRPYSGALPSDCRMVHG
jgi:uncharacterized protein (DUF2147 family)